MNSTDIHTAHIDELDVVHALHINPIGDDVELWLSVNTDDKGVRKTLRRIPCASPEQAHSVARLYRAVWL